MADIIDLTLLRDARRCLDTMLAAKGLNYFLCHDAKRPFRLEPTRVESVVRAASRSASGGTRRHRPHVKAVDHARNEIRRELIRRVVAEMLQTGL